MNWDYRVAYGAVKNFKHFPKHDQKRIFAAMEEMKTDPFRGGIKPIQGEENVWRRKVGAYRIYFRPIYEQHVLDIPEIERKQSH